MEDTNVKHPLTDATADHRQKVALQDHQDHVETKVILDQMGQMVRMAVLVFLELSTS